MCDWRYGNSPLAIFIESMRDDFYNNMTTKDYISYEGVKIQKGTKIVKAFKFFEKDKHVLETLQVLASQLIQEDKVTGRLCFSVHPLDFLSSSENIHNWRSCHALDGDYRAGNLSYMVDNSTFMCYLRAEDDKVILPNFPEDVKWNSKKWRTLMFMSWDWSLMFAGRQYPFASSSGINAIKAEIERMSHSSWGDWHQQMVDKVYSEDDFIYLNRTYIPVGNDIKPLTDVIIDPKRPLHYNDLLKSSVYKPKFSYRKGKYGNALAKFTGLSDLATSLTIGGDVKCLCCETENIGYSASMRCIECEEEYGEGEDDYFGYCECCGRRTYLEDAYYIRGDQIVCQQCFDNVIYRCDCCGEYYLDEEITYDRENELYICNWCKEMD